jgi:serine/threonine-protein kinase
MSYASQARQRGALANQVLADYRIGELIASGGTTEVYRGRNQSQGYQVAIKVMVVPDTAGSDLRKRFTDEARCMMTLHHPHIVPLKAFGEVEGALYLVMPLYPETLRDHLEQSGPLPPVRAVRMALQVASALQVTHARDLAHRDVKPENIFLNVHGAAFLADFGITREISALQRPDVAWTRSSIGLPVGTPEYMAPEQLLEKPADQRVDVYGLAAVLYESLTGRALFEAETPWAVAALALSHQITPPSACARDIWPRLEQTVLRALAYEAADRYADMETFAVALRTALGVMERERDHEIWHADLATQAEAPLQPQSACPEVQVADLQAQPTIAGARGGFAQGTSRAVARTLRALSLRRVEMAPHLNSLRAPISAVGAQLKRRIGGWRETLLTILQRM